MGQALDVGALGIVVPVGLGQIGRSGEAGALQPHGVEAGELRAVPHIRRVSGRQTGRMVGQREDLLALGDQCPQQAALGVGVEALGAQAGALQQTQADLQAKQTALQLQQQGYNLEHLKQQEWFLLDRMLQCLLKEKESSPLQ